MTLVKELFVMPTKQLSPYSKMLQNLQQYCKNHDVWKEEMLLSIPKKWEKHGDMVILPPSAFRSLDWQSIGYDSLWPLVASSLNAKKLGRKRNIADDNFRTPHIELLYGDNGWVEHIDNRIRYQYDVTKCMFSIGNITEKLRVAQLKCHGQTVVDLFAGIGYFTLPYLVHAGASHVYACEWNPDAANALRKNLSVNGVEDRCTVIEGDCRQSNLVGVADHVNLGLLPTASSYYLTACKVLKTCGGILHIHENVTDSKISQKTSTVAKEDKEIVAVCDETFNTLNSAWQEFALNSSTKCVNFLNNMHDTSWTARILRVFKVKSYAPHIDHIVVDCELRPKQ